MTLRALHDGWSVRAAGGPVPAAVTGRSVPAVVPGCVHTDLLAAGLIPDPYLDDHEHLVAWIGRCDWEYRTTFGWSPDGHERHDLVLHGLDTVATVVLNGQELARTANQHRTYRLDARAALVDGANELVVTFESPVRYADRQSLELGYRPHTMHHPYNAMRKSACNFGWDWGPDLATAGIWRPVELHAWSGVRLASVRPLTTVDGDTGRLGVHAGLEYAAAQPGAPVTVTVAVEGILAAAEVPAGAPSAVVEVEIPGVRRWWPRGYGEQPLYPLDVRVSTGGAAADAVTDRWTGRVGFRTVRLDIEPDEHGTSFGFVVNDQPVAVRGANWIPDDVFVHRVDRARYARRLDQAEQANLNLLRVWGGGVYESGDFYDLCDERGILVWQDFLFACAAYAEEEPLAGEVEAEVRDNVVRLLPHPSLVLWNGNNENLWGFEDWGWQPRLDGRSWGLGYYTGLLPRLVAELDPHRPYTPGSPFSPPPVAGGAGDPAPHPNDPHHGTVHLWDQWNRLDHATYRDTEPRFVAEFGWQGPPTWSTLRRAISDDPLTPESPGMIVHQKAGNGNDKLTDGLVPHLPVPGDVEDWHWAMSLNQAVAIAVAVEHFRSLGSRCTGSIVWQLNDCWPVTSWAAVDGDGRAKPLLYALRHAYADRLLTVQPRDGGLVAVVVNDSPSAWDGELSLRRLTYDGDSLAAATVPVSAPPRASVPVPVPGAVAAAGDAAAELVVASVGDVRGLWFFADYRDSRLTAPRLRAVAEPAGDDGYRVRVTAESLVRDLALLADKAHPDAVVDDQLVTLLPGEQVTFRVSAPPGLDPAAFMDPRVLRTANDLLPSS
ncbi:glycoside hydrolase family 2 protein [Jiangella ureilytica]|uniref:beta-mannosidase n=1 Tax=Jiangella ureilytica TaxID=2530374 RepID=A0A4R4RJP1_9ACTN|nr:glycoside hydrolase family 2 protein [Jiangella ureilytica]TDC49189.1 glycoside hydrolase family 2 protein [Jiangella ureilytica]